MSYELIIVFLSALGSVLCYFENATNRNNFIQTQNFCLCIEYVAVMYKGQIN